MAWLLRRKVRLCGRLVDTRDIQLKELLEAKHLTLEHEQYVSFQQEKSAVASGELRRSGNVWRMDPEIHDGLLRVRGRLRNSRLDYSAKHPIFYHQKESLQMC